MLSGTSTVTICGIDWAMGRLEPAPINSGFDLRGSQSGGLDVCDAIESNLAGARGRRPSLRAHRAINLDGLQL